MKNHAFKPGIKNITYNLLTVKNMSKVAKYVNNYSKGKIDAYIF